MGSPQGWADELRVSHLTVQEKGVGQEKRERVPGKTHRDCHLFPAILPAALAFSKHCPHEAVSRPKLPSTVQQAGSPQVLGRANIPFPGPVDEHVCFRQEVIWCRCGLGTNENSVKEPLRE